MSEIRSVPVHTLWTPGNILFCHVFTVLIVLQSGGILLAFGVRENILFYGPRWDIMRTAYLIRSSYMVKFYFVKNVFFFFMILLYYLS